MHEEKPDLAKGAMKAMQDLYDVVTHDILSSTLRYCCDFMILVLNDLIVEKIMEFDSLINQTQLAAKAELFVMEQGLTCYRRVKLGSSKLNLWVHRSNSGSQVTQVFCGLTNLTHRSNHKTCTNASINAKVETTLIFNKFCFQSFCQAEFLIIGSCLFFVNWIFEILWCQHTFYWIYHIIDHSFYLSIL